MGILSWFKKDKQRGDCVAVMGEHARLLSCIEVLVTNTVAENQRLLVAVLADGGPQQRRAASAIIRANQSMMPPGPRAEDIRAGIAAAMEEEQASATGPGEAEQVVGMGSLGGIGPGGE